MQLTIYKTQDTNFRNVCDICRELKIIHEMGPREWAIIAELRDILAPFAEAVKRLEGENYSTISEVYPVIFSLKEKLRQVIFV
jgi:hypothetical protein